MFRRKLLVLLWAFIFLYGAAAYGKKFELYSPDKEIKLTVDVGRKVLYSVFYGSREIIKLSPISMVIQGKGRLGIQPVITDTKTRSVNEKIRPVIRVKSEIIPDVFNELSIVFKGKFGLVFRAYDEGVAYRFVTRFKNPIKVECEEVVFNFAGDHSIYFPLEESFMTHQERLYEYLPLSKISEKKMCSLPALVDIEQGPKVAITEADLKDYAGLYLRGTNEPSLHGIFPMFSLEEKQTRDRDVHVKRRADYIAETSGSRDFPWRVLIFADEDGDLIETQMIYKLAGALELKDTSWIRPGKVAWDWWNANNIFGVDFRAGINTETYKYYIDFASQYGIEYIILDEGWYVLGNLMDIKPEIDMEELVQYGRAKGVGLILWVVWKTLEDQLVEALDQFEEWGIKGIKVDFMQRDDQWMVNYYRKIAREAAKRRLLVDLHGAYKPTGLRRAYPNILTREGVIGLENSKWSEKASPEHNVTIPFIRMLAGPMDYTPGAMINSQKKNFKPVFYRPMSMGTRCHQMAMYVVFESPLQMLSDSPSLYLKEKECMEFLAEVPVVWDETRVLEARVADYVLIARRSGSDWYVGAMTDWTPRELVLDFFFLGEGEYTAEIYMDGINADRYGSDYKKNARKVSSETSLKIKLAPGGGWAARIKPDKKQ